MEALDHILIALTIIFYGSLIISGIMSYIAGNTNATKEIKRRQKECIERENRCAEREKALQAREFTVSSEKACNAKLQEKAKELSAELSHARMDAAAQEQRYKDRYEAERTALLKNYHAKMHELEEKEALLEKNRQANAEIVKELTRLRRQFQSAESKAHQLYDYHPSHAFDSAKNAGIFVRAYTPDFNFVYPLSEFYCEVKSGKNTYRTSLQNCTCKYRQEHPDTHCKHMIALGLHLGFAALSDSEKEKTLREYNKLAAKLHELDANIKKESKKIKKATTDSSPKK